MRSPAVVLVVCLFAVPLAGQIDPIPPSVLRVACSAGGGSTCAAGVPMMLTVASTTSNDPLPNGTYNWTFGDGTTATTTSPSTTHTYLALGYHLPFVLGTYGGGATVYITANPESTVTASTATPHVSETAGSVTMVLTRSGNLSIASTVSYVVYGTGTIIPTKIDNLQGSVTFQPGETTKSVILPVNDDSYSSGTATQPFVISATDGTVAVGYVPVTIDEDDPPPSVRIDDVRVVEGTAVPTVATFTVTFSSPPGIGSYFAYALTDGTAHRGIDYGDPAYGGIVVSPFATTGTLSVPILPNATPERDKTFTITIQSLLPTLVNVTRATATATIVNDEYALAPSPLELTTGATAQLTLDLGQPFDVATDLPLDADRSVLTVAPSVTAPVGTSSVQFAVAAKAAGSTAVVVHLPNGDARTTVLVTDPATLIADPQTVTLGVGGETTVHLTIAPPRNADTIVTLTPSAGGIATTADTITIPAAGTADVRLHGTALGSTTITASAPHAAPATIGVNVQAANGPRVDHVAPFVIPTSGGRIAIVGKNLATDCRYAFDSVVASGVEPDARGVSAIAPSHDAGTVDLAVTCGSGTFVLPQALTYGNAKPHAAR